MNNTKYKIGEEVLLHRFINLYRVYKHDDGQDCDRYSIIINDTVYPKNAFEFYKLNKPVVIESVSEDGYSVKCSLGDIFPMIIHEVMIKGRKLETGDIVKIENSTEKFLFCRYRGDIGNTIAVLLADGETVTVNAEDVSLLIKEITMQEIAEWQGLYIENIRLKV